MSSREIKPRCKVTTDVQRGSGRHHTDWSHSKPLRSADQSLGRPSGRQHEMSRCAGFEHVVAAPRAVPGAHKYVFAVLAPALPGQVMAKQPLVSLYEMESLLQLVPSLVTAA